MSKIRTIVVSEQPEPVRNVINQIVNDKETEREVIEGRTTFKRDALFGFIESRLNCDSTDEEMEAAELLGDVHNSLEEDELVEFVS